MKDRFLIVNPFGIGDVLFTTPLIHALKENFPESLVGYLCNQRTQDILINNPFVDKIFPLSRGDIAKIYRKSKIKGIKQFICLLRDIKTCNFGYAFDLSLESRYSFGLKLLGIPRRIGFDFKGRGMFLTDKIRIDGYKDKPIVEYYLDLLKVMGVNRNNPYGLKIYFSEDEKKWSDTWLKDNNIKDGEVLIGISPGGGASWGSERYLKLYTVERFSELIDRLSKEFSCKIIIFGDRDDAEYCNILKNKIKYPVLFCCGIFSLREFACILSRCNILITNDGGPLHLATAVDVKTVSIFGPVDERVYGPYPGDEFRHLVIKKILDCRPCYKNFRILNCDKRVCLDIGVDEIFKAVKRLLGL